MHRPSGGPPVRLVLGAAAALGLLAGGCAPGPRAGAGRSATTGPTVAPVATTRDVVEAPTTTAAPVPAIPFVTPIQPDNRPTPIAGDTNGEMPASHLVGVAPNCVASRAAAPSLGLLLATARNTGVALGTNECYRPVSGQVAASKRVTAAGNSACAARPVTTPSGT